MDQMSRNNMSNHILSPGNYRIESLEDEIRVDRDCRDLLQHFHRYLLTDKAKAPLVAGSRASGADFFLRDYMIDRKRCNIFEISVPLVKAFAGHWYIISTLEPNMAELEEILLGISDFYNFCQEKGLIDAPLAKAVTDCCSDLDYYRQRIQSFNKLTGEEYSTWTGECPLD